MGSFEFAETMAGSFRRVDVASDDRPMSFTIRARAKSLFGFLRHPEVEIEGEVDAEGFADHEHLRGTLEMDLIGKRRLSYAFTFSGNDGKPYAFWGEKIVKPPFAEAMTILPGTIKDDAGKTVAEALLRFDLRSDLVRFVKSWRRTI